MTTNPSPTEATLIREVAERYLKEEIFPHKPYFSGKEQCIAWFDTNQNVTPREHAHIISLAERKLNEAQAADYYWLLAGHLILDGKHKWIFQLPLPPRATALLSLSKE